jgi:hypothetical protein
MSNIRINCLECYFQIFCVFLSFVIYMSVQHLPICLNIMLFGNIMLYTILILNRILITIYKNMTMKQAICIIINHVLLLIVNSIVYTETTILWNINIFGKLYLCCALYPFIVVGVSSYYAHKRYTE